MERRKFIQSTAIAGLPLMMGGIPLNVLSSPLDDSLKKLGSKFEDRVLVLVQLNGGNDGLNTLIPIDQYANLTKVRSNVLIPENKIIKIKDDIGLHPSMTHFKSMFDSDLVGMVQSVGYPDPNFSHFRSTDIFTSASDASVVESTGWMGRYLEGNNTTYPKDYPNETNPHPLAITIGGTANQTCQGSSVNMGIAVNNLTSSFTGGAGGETGLSGRGGHEVEFIRNAQLQTQAYLSVVSDAGTKGNNLSTKYPVAKENKLADQLKIVANLISGGLKTKVYVVNLGGFDTHDEQIDTITGDTTIGNHADLLHKLSEAIDAFQDDIQLLGLQDRVVGMTFSEFGRRIKSNDSYGTDHGAAAPLFVFGTNVNPVIHGANPTIPDVVEKKDSVPMLYDFRSVYASILQDWFGLETTEVETIMYRKFDHIQVIKRETPTGVESANSSVTTISLYPNPTTDYLNINFALESESHTQISIFNSIGQEIDLIFSKTLSSGNHKFTYDCNHLKSGAYYLRFTINGVVSSKSFVKV